MFSPSFEIKPRRISSTLIPSSNGIANNCSSVSILSAFNKATVTLLTKPTKSSALATKSVSQLISTIATALPSSLTLTPIIPSAAIRPDFLSALAKPDLRIFSMANSMSPSASTKALLHSIIPEAVLSRNSFTIAALILILILVFP